MFCYQCQETANCTGCTLTGVCGKNPQVAAAQDLLVYVTKGYCEVTTRLRKEGTNISDAENRMVVMNLFMTITNANFDKEAIANRIHDTLHVKKELLKKVRDTSGLTEAALWDGSGDWEAIARKVGVLSNPDEDIRSLQQLITYGIKGLCAYTKHANALMHTDPKLDAFIQETLAKTLDNSLSAEELVALTLKTGEYGVKGMAMLDAANTGAYGDPEITAVNIGVRKNPGILVSGHDLRDLEMLLEQTKGTGVDVYTHSEMLPACSYPAFKKYPHFVGNYGNAWWQQKEEFESFNGPILMTTICIVPPKASYKDRVFTTEMVSFPDVTHIDDEKDFTPVIEKALELGGYAEDTQFTGINGGTEVTTGFAHGTVLGVADKVIEAVKSGAIRHFFLVGGCDGVRKGRNYYTDFVKQTPDDTIILTLACGKYRFNDLDLGTIGGLPRIMDMGQCNDAYSAIKVAVALAEAFNCSVNELPLSMILSWYEQKAVCILLTLLHLGIKDIRLGPTLPAFISPNVLNYLAENYNIAPVTTPEEDLKTILG